MIAQSQKNHLEPESVFHLIRQSLHCITFYNDIKREGEVPSLPKRKLVDDLLRVPRNVQFSVEFYSQFWSLRLSDINVPTQEYEKTIKISMDGSKIKLFQNSELKEQEKKFMELYRRLESDKGTWFQ